MSPIVKKITVLLLLTSQKLPIKLSGSVDASPKMTTHSSVVILHRFLKRREVVTLPIAIPPILADMQTILAHGVIHTRKNSMIYSNTHRLVFCFPLGIATRTDKIHIPTTIRNTKLNSSIISIT